jgi:hypothetical protein
MKHSNTLTVLVAFFLLINIIAVPVRNYAEGNNITLVHNYLYVPAISLTANPAHNVSGSSSQGSAETNPAHLIKDFSYLKFYALGYENTDPKESEITSNSSFCYLKFKVSDYNTKDDPEIDATLDLPIKEFAYLKFDVTKFSKNYTEEFNENVETLELNFNYLKFEVEYYVAQTNPINGKFTELPANNLAGHNNPISQHPE